MVLPGDRAFGVSNETPAWPGSEFDGDDIDADGTVFGPEVFSGSLGYASKLSLLGCTDRGFRSSVSGRVMPGFDLDDDDRATIRRETDDVRFSRADSEVLREDSVAGSPEVSAGYTLTTTARG